MGEFVCVLCGVLYVACVCVCVLIVVGILFVLFLCSILFGIIWQVPACLMRFHIKIYVKIRMLECHYYYCK